MWGLIDERLKKILTLDDQQMTRKSKRRNEGGGLIFLGVCFILMGIANYLFLEIIYDSRIVFLAISAGGVILGVVSLIFGIRIFGQTGQSVAESWAESNHYTVEEILEFNRECRMDNALVVHSDYWNEEPPESIYELQEKHALETGFITENWFKAPDTITVDIMRLRDIAAIWYEPKELGGRYEGVYYVKAGGKREYFRAGARIGGWIVSEIGKRNPMTAAERVFEADGVSCDAYKNPADAARLYLSRRAG